MQDGSFAETLDAAKGGDEAAFTVLFRMAQPAVLRYLRVIAPQRAEDIAGDTWVQVIRGLPTFVADEPVAFRAWVLTIARHRWMDDVRARSRRPELLTDDVPESADRDDVQSIVDHVVSTESALALIARLPKDQAEVVSLRYIGDLDVASTAEVVGKTPGTVRVLCHRGLRRLAEIVRSSSTAGQV